MKKEGVIFWGIFIIILLPFFVSDTVYAYYLKTNAAHPYIMAFVKFAILSTAGEIIGLRIKSGHYFQKGFGILPRMVIWGLLGILIAYAMKIFSTGVPQALNGFGIGKVAEAMTGQLSWLKFFGALMISISMNTIFAPVMMTIHKVTDTHIMSCGGSVKALITPIPFGNILSKLNWKVQWGFVFKKTIPLFWYPAHTITFLLPPQYQVLFAASLGVALGIILSFAARSGK
jgi:hypothetical protein